MKSNRKREDFYIQQLLGQNAEAILDQEIKKMAEDIGQQQYNAFAAQYFAKLNVSKLKPGSQQAQHVSNSGSSDESSYDEYIENTEAGDEDPPAEPHVQISNQPLGDGSDSSKRRITYKNGDTYQGEVSQNMKNGWGVYKYANSQKYDGTFVQDEIHGYGIYHFKSGAKYDGYWFEGLKHGVGTLTFANKDKYEGQFKDDQMHGKGIYYYANGDKFQGVWRDGKKHGRGEFNGVDGRFIIGEWQEDKFCQ